MKKITLDCLRLKKHPKEGTPTKISAITAYDALFASLFDPLVDLILVGDSLNMSFNGQSDTLSARMDAMLYHTKAVCRGVKRAFLVADMPYGSYTNTEHALKNALRFYKHSSADAIKLEGGVQRARVVKALVEEGLAVVGHVGLTPQSVRGVGGYKIAGKTAQSAQQVLEDALAIEEAGARLIVLEGVVANVAEKITNTLKIPTIGIGSGIHCDGQILVFSDMLGFFTAFKPKFVRSYLEGATLVQEAVKNYVRDVQTGNFPSPEESY
ncbi:3-methyl-2-oxobutanoate hydroxymethyltransferase [Helicobacter suis]|uniref:3-methyl-2-oxobutanoate hydroxymethyltransferase n=2 Tax=Helicobacter suis TaxID=104628 RepID=E7G2L9_9HELI|nr:3-methyl-2-oxobutanoate hydroxymethyltransferase [Helicobacter suis]EFX42368.1 3-methyl-2-oxobutanoate hydroxymethyltransferase [Helicobacter suis HS5]EFX43105.1 3-methyl-2-oxobutanoate hydroxymethyltransferase [Helicobacter suis HS1]BCD44965.1 3-methyl-2-oxobutanoate hydroxymethyltransferase PanB [Helicobacter suis]BCD46800.1 3-methyl-2-oxobutanoate hydroxymethyltransferase PanB [Helicobacter suis]BCD48557.1 3-methyl-2-oxobutanoate hydroxymethyltransferase PanB [Helicobacter suis]